MMQVSSSARRFPRVLDRIPVLLRPQPSLSSDPVDAVDGLPLCGQWPRPRSFSFQTPRSFVTTNGNPRPSTTMSRQLVHHPLCSPMVRACFSSVANKETRQPSEIVQELYQKMSKSVEARTMPPNAWLWSLISNCANQEDIKLLFQMLQKLRIFRLSNLRIHANFNCHLCMRVSEACARAGALEYGLKALRKHNVYGLTPTIGSAHYLLLHAKEHKDAKLMVKIMDVLQKNSLPLQPGTADIVFSICYDTNKWDLISKYAKRFIKAGVKLHRTAFDIWMEFAAKIGDAQSIWKIEKLRAKSVKGQTLASGFSCAKGFLLEGNPESAAATIHLLYQNLPDQKKLRIPDELQRLISEWPLEVIKRQKKEDRKTLAESFKSDIPAMVTSLLNMGLDVTVDLEKLSQQEI
ncbi:uncharacterized protein LOC103699901 [Phoenix dactylifera]|uniref:Uncharacterized protein LOC103699901 n=1 Tax=Phoenix dactylifera TaxID=42345 RepID=A0A8B7BKV8_PHODC|nr:uncharacterized protein LOC103699901 [Phoenix dactylifera]